MQLDSFMLGAAGITDDAKKAVADAMSATSTDVTALMVDVLPYALGVMAVGWGVKKATGFFKGTAR